MPRHVLATPVEHAGDVLNRTTGPPYDGKELGSPGDRGTDSVAFMTSHQHVTGEPPKILNILPLGCRAYAVKPRNAFVKSGFASRGWIGVNLGRSYTILSAYNVWLPEQKKVIQTPEVYFDESLFPWRPNGDQRTGMPLPSAAPPAALSDLTAGGAPNAVAAGLPAEPAPTASLLESA